MTVRTLRRKEAASAGAEPVHLKVVHEIYPLSEAFRRDWERLYALTPGANVFVSLEWLEQGWRSFAPEGDAIRPVRFIDEKGETKAACLHRETVIRRPLKHITLWRTLDYNSQRIAPVLAPDVDFMAAALFALRESVGHRIDAFDFFKLDALEGKIEGLCARLESWGLGSVLELFNEQPVMRLSGTFEEYLASRSKYGRKTLRRNLKKVRERVGPYRLVRLRDPGDYEKVALDALLGEIFTLFEKSWQYEEIVREGKVTPEQVKRFYEGLARAAAPTGRLDLNLLYAGERLVSFDLNLVEKGAVYMIFGAYDQKLRDCSPGTALFTEWLKDSHARGDRVLEFGGEFLDYKEKWTREKKPSYHLRIPGGTVKARLKAMMGKK